MCGISVPLLSLLPNLRVRGRSHEEIKMSQFCKTLGNNFMTILLKKMDNMNLEKLVSGYLVVGSSAESLLAGGARTV